MFSYDDVHDHNFSFLTANYFFDEYETDVLTNPKSKSQALDEGKNVDLRFQDRFKLTKGVQIFFERGVDIHSQITSSNFTKSSNLLLADAANEYLAQHFFDPSSGRVSGYAPGSSLMRRTQLLRLARQIGDINTLDLLQWFGQQHPFEYTKKVAASQEKILADVLVAQIY